MPQKRGFAAMNTAQQRAIAAEGGRAAHEKGTAHEFTREEAAQAGRKGGQSVSRNREHMAAIGRKGGLAAHHRKNNGTPAESSAPAGLPMSGSVTAAQTGAAPAAPAPTETMEAAAPFPLIP
jgi:general stress protein YciG